MTSTKTTKSPARYARGVKFVSGAERGHKTWTATIRGNVYTIHNYGGPIWSAKLGTIPMFSELYLSGAMDRLVREVEAMPL